MKIVKRELEVDHSIARVQAPRRRLRIALVTEHFLPKVDGVVTSIIHTLDHLQRFGHEVTVFAPAAERSELHGARIVSMRAAPAPHYREKMVGLPTPSLLAELSALQPDIVHAINPLMAGVASLAFARARGVPTIVSIHTDYPKYLRSYGLGHLAPSLSFMSSWLVKRANLGLCPSEYMCDRLRDYGAQNVGVWPGGVDLEAFHPNLASRELRSELSGGDPDAPLMLYVGRLAKEKSVDKLLAVLRAFPELRLAIVGDGPERGALEAHFAGTRARFFGYAKGQRLSAIYASSDFLVLPSRTETLGLVVLEAMAAGCPAVAARDGGVPEIITSERDGILFDPNRPLAIVEAVARMLACSDRPAFRRRVREVAQGWSWQIAARTLERAYMTLIPHEGSRVMPR